MLSALQTATWASYSAQARSVLFSVIPGPLDSDLGCMAGPFAGHSATAWPVVGGDYSSVGRHQMGDPVVLRDRPSTVLQS